MTTSLGSTRFGKVVYRVLGGVGDGPDANITPDGIPITGTGTLTPRVERILDTSTSPAQTIIPRPIKVTFSGGNLTYRGDPWVWLIASEAGVWQWHASFTYKVGGETITDEFTFDLPPGNPDDPSYVGTDLSTARLDVDPSTGLPTGIGPAGRSVVDIVVKPDALLFVMSSGVDIEASVPGIGRLAGAADRAENAASRAETSASTASTDASTATEAATTATTAVGEAVAARNAAKEDADRADAASDEAVDAAANTVSRMQAAIAAAQSADGSATTATTARDETVEAATIAVGAAELANLRAGDATTARQGAIDARDEAEQFAQQAAGVVPPASANEFGKIKLRGDLGGTAENPTVPALTGKRDVVTGTNRVYTTDGSGTQANVPYSSAATASTIMLRDTAGRTKVGTPAAAADAVTKEYVDTLLAKKADLGADGKTLQSQQNAIAVTDFLGNVASETAMLALVGQRGDWCNRTDLGTEWQLVAEPSTSLSSWMQKIYPASDVTSVAGRKGAVTISSADVTDATATGRAVMKAASAAAARTAVGLDQVDNTRDQDKPVSVAVGNMITNLEQTIAANVARKFRDGGQWSPTKNYSGGEVVTYNHGRYYCIEGHLAYSVFPSQYFVWLGLAAVAATTDPGGGRLWVKL